MLYSPNILVKCAIEFGAPIAFGACVLVLSGLPCELSYTKQPDPHFHDGQSHDQHSQDQQSQHQV